MQHILSIYNFKRAEEFKQGTCKYLPPRSEVMRLSTFFSLQVCLSVGRLNVTDKLLLNFAHKQPWCKKMTLDFDIFACDLYMD